MRIGAYEAKAKLSALLDRVARGERITITKHGRAVAVLVPPPGTADRTVDEAISRLLEFRRGKRLGMSVARAREAGRR